MFRLGGLSLSNPCRLGILINQEKADFLHLCWDWDYDARNQLNYTKILKEPVAIVDDPKEPAFEQKTDQIQTQKGINSCWCFRGQGNGGLAGIFIEWGNIQNPIEQGQIREDGQSADNDKEEEAEKGQTLDGQMRDKEGGRILAKSKEEEENSAQGHPKANWLNDEGRLDILAVPGIPFVKVIPLLKQYKEGVEEEDKDQQNFNTWKEEEEGGDEEWMMVWGISMEKGDFLWSRLAI